MKFKPIHEISSDELNHILYRAKQFIEWNIEPKYCQLHALIDSIKESMVYFMPNDGDLIQNINDANEALLIINTFTIVPHPLKEGLIVLRELYEIINTNGNNLYLYQLTAKIRNYLDTIEPFVLREELNKYHSKQRKIRGKRQTWKGKTRVEIEADKKKIVEHFIEHNQITEIKPNSFAEIHAEEYGYSTKTIRNILKSHLGN